MSDSVRKFLINTGIGLVLAILTSCLLGLFQVDTAVDTLRILCDGFFVAAAGLLCAGGIQWTTNGGVMDGFGFAAKTGIARMRRDFETAKLSFADYRENRRQKNRSPKYLLLAGLLHMVIAVALYWAYTSVR